MSFRCCRWTFEQSHANCFPLLPVFMLSSANHLLSPAHTDMRLISIFSSYSQKVMKRFPTCWIIPGNILPQDCSGCLWIRFLAWAWSRGSWSVCYHSRLFARSSCHNFMSHHKVYFPKSQILIHKAWFLSIRHYFKNQLFSWNFISLFEMEWERNLPKFDSRGFWSLTVDSSCLAPSMS